MTDVLPAPQGWYKAQLSKREKEVLSKCVLGLRNKEIGLILFISEKTVKFHLTMIYRKLGLKSRCQLILYERARVETEPKPSIASLVVKAMK